jgi:hypothetical protein
MPAGVCGKATGPVNIKNINSTTHNVAFVSGGVRYVIFGIFNGVIL